MGIIGVGMVGGQLMRYFLEEKKYQRAKELFLFDTDAAKGYADDINAASIIFICVPTPRDTRTGACDLSILESAIHMVKEPKVIVLKSTIPPGTTEHLQQAYPEHAFLFNPEFLTESRAWEDMLRPDRQIVGHTARSFEHASTVLQLLPKAFFSSPGTLGTYTFTRVNATEAELGKYAGNTFGALKVTFANVLADFCELGEEQYQKNSNNVSVQYTNIRAILAHDHRIGDAWLDVEHGLYRGFGGYCFPKDVSALIAHGRDLLEKLPENHPHKNQYEKGIRLLEAMWEYNKELLRGQNLTIEDVSMHDKEWITKRVKE